MYDSILPAGIPDLPGFSVRPFGLVSHAIMVHDVQFLQLDIQSHLVSGTQPFSPFISEGGENVWAMALLGVVHSGISYLLQTPTRNTIMRLHTCNLRTCASTVDCGEAQRTARRGAFG